MLIPVLSKAGAETQVEHLAKGLARLGDEVTLVCIKRTRRDLSPLLEAGVRVIILHALNRAARARILARLVSLARRSDLVHCTMWDATLWGRLAAGIARRPSVVTEHSPGREYELSDAGASRASWIALHNRLLDRVTYATVVVARWQVGLLVSEGVRAESIVHIPNGVPVEELRSRAGSLSREELGLPSDALVVVHVARFQRQKNQPLVLDMVARLREELGDVRAVFVGDGPDREAIERGARARGADWALFLGYRRDAPAIIALADLAVLPSSAEAMPMSVIEAIALGVPVVGTDVGDVRATIEESGGGLWVPAGDAEAFFAACRSVLTDEALRERLAATGRAGIASVDAVKMVARYSALFDSAVAGSPPAGRLP